MEDDQNLLGGHQEQYETVNKKSFTLLYSWGRNEDGQLAISNSKSIFLPSAPQGLKGYARQIATARTHTAVLNHKGEIYMTGSLKFGILGFQAQVSNLRTFRIQQHMRQYHVKQVACGDFHTLALTQDGRVFSWGGHLWDKTGHKGVGIHQIEKLSSQTIVEIACGDFHSVALNNRGQVYSWGGGGDHKNKGQLGHSNKNNLPHPELIQFFKKKEVIKIACGQYHTMVMTADDQLYSFGEGNFGQLGTGGKDDSATPKKVIINFSLPEEQYFRLQITDKVRVQQMALGGHHSLLLTNIGHVYVCGYGSQGQLGLGQGNTENKYQPTLVKSLLGKQIIMVAAGANHSLALTARHDVYSCGYNAKGQLGVGQKKSCTVWTHVTHLAQKNVGRVYAGGDHSWAVIDQTCPTIQNYQPPSPIKIAIDQPTIIKHQRSQLSGNSVNDILVQMISNKRLELILTEVQYSHRFIHFVVKENIKSYKKKVDQYIKVVYQNERKEMKFHKVNEDSDMYDAKGKIMLPANPKGCTIMLVCEVPGDATEYLYCDPPKTSIAIGDLLIMEASMLKSDKKIPVHNQWFFKFCEMFDDILQRVRFIELRPKQIK